MAPRSVMTNPRWPARRSNQTAIVRNSFVLHVSSLALLPQIGAKTDLETEKRDDNCLIHLAKVYSLVNDVYVWPIVQHQMWI